MVGMGAVVELERWRREREPARVYRWHPSRQSHAGLDPWNAWSPAAVEGAVDADEVARLERAVERLDRASSRLLARSRPLGEQVETELLAVIGAVSMGMLGDAAGRAERLADQLGTSRAKRR